MFGLKDMTGAVMSPFDAFLMARGLKTLDIRMERHCANARKVADFFASHPAVAKVYYPGLDTFPGHEIAEKQMKLAGGMISIELKADRAAVAAALNKLQLCTIAVSRATRRPWWSIPPTMTHSHLLRRGAGRGPASPRAWSASAWAWRTRRTSSTTSRRCWITL